MTVHDGGFSVGTIVTSSPQHYQAYPVNRVPRVHSIQARRIRAVSPHRSPSDAITDTHLTGAGMRLYEHVHRCGELHEAQQAIADYLNISRMTVYRQVRYLVSAGYLIIQRGKPHTYRVSEGQEDTRA